MDNTRLRYPGLVVFGARFASLFTGFVFTIIVTNKLSEADFGIWQVVQNAQGYTVFLIPVVSYWTVRYLARGTETGRSSLISSIILSAPASLIYLFVSLFFVASLKTSFIYFLIGWFQIPIFHMVNSLESISQGTKPQLQSYAFLASEIAKLVFAVPLLIFLKQGLEMVLTIIILTQIVQLVMLVILNKKHLVDKFDFSLVKHWIKLSWIPIFTAIPPLIYTFDVAIVTYLTKTAESIAFYKAAFLLASFITYGQYLGIALYPRILKGGNSKDVESILKIILMFIIPFSLGIYFISDQLLYLLKSSYMQSRPALDFLIPASFITVFYLFFDSILTGTVHSEVDKNVSLFNLLKSRLLLVPKIGIVFSVSYLICLYLLLHFFDQKNGDYMTISILWSIAALIAIIPFAVYKGILARRILHFRVPSTSIAKYLISSGVMIAIIVILKTFIPFELPKTIYSIMVAGEILVAVLAYFSLLYGIDPEFRGIIKSVISTKMKDS
ncbi:MAG: hypothetical protein ACREAD_01200 [Nitrosopumilaceae archaeon]